MSSHRQKAQALLDQYLKGTALKIAGASALGGFAGDVLDGQDEGLGSGLGALAGAGLASYLLGKQSIRKGRLGKQYQATSSKQPQGIVIDPANPPSKMPFQQQLDLMDQIRLRPSNPLPLTPIPEVRPVGVPGTADATYQSITGSLPEVASLGRGKDLTATGSLPVVAEKKPSRIAGDWVPLGDTYFDVEEAEELMRKYKPEILMGEGFV